MCKHKSPSLVRAIRIFSCLLRVNHDDALREAGLRSGRQEGLMTDQTGFDANHVRVFVVTKVGDFGRLFRSGIPHDGTHGADGALDLAGGFNANGSGAPRMHIGMHDGMFFGVQVNTIRFALKDDGVVVRLDMVLAATDLFSTK